MRLNVSMVSTLVSHASILYQSIYTHLYLTTNLSQQMGVIFLTDARLLFLGFGLKESELSNIKHSNFRLLTCGF